MSSHRLNFKNNGHVFTVLVSKIIFGTLKILFSVVCCYRWQVFSGLPENVLVSSVTNECDYPQIKLCAFGFARCNRGEVVPSTCGRNTSLPCNPGGVLPEVCAAVKGMVFRQFTLE